MIRTFINHIKKKYKEFENKYIVRSVKRQNLFNKAYKEYMTSMVNLAHTYNSFIRVCGVNDFDIISGIFGVCNKNYGEQFHLLSMNAFEFHRSTITPTPYNVGINRPGKTFNFIRERCATDDKLYSKETLEKVYLNTKHTRDLNSHMEKFIKNIRAIKKLSKLRENFFNDDIIYTVLGDPKPEVIKIIRSNYVAFMKYREVCIKNNVKF